MGGSVSARTLTPARVAPRTNNSIASRLPWATGGVGDGVSIYNKTTLGNGYLGSRIDEERSEMRYLV